MEWLELGGTLKDRLVPALLPWGRQQSIRSDCSKAYSRDKASTTSVFFVLDLILNIGGCCQVLNDNKKVECTNIS